MTYVLLDERMVIGKVQAMETAMKTAHNQPSLTILDIRTEFSRYRFSRQYAKVRRTRAAVAMLLRESPQGIEVLFIERASSDRDPWSGHLAFPGGKVEPGERALQAAERETLEEIGLELGTENYIGRMSDIIGANLPVRVSCFVYEVSATSTVTVASPEVRDVFWVPLSSLLPSNNTLATVGFSGKILSVPAIVVPQPDKPVLWGLTYRLVMQFMEIMDLRS